VNERKTPYYQGEYCPNVEKHDGALRWAVGASNYQVMRANRHRPEEAEDLGWTYNHAPDLTYFAGKFHLAYLANPVDEHRAPGASFLTTSADGVHWAKPIVVFPPMKIPAGVVTDADGVDRIIADDVYAIMHQRMAFYQANGRLLALGFYGNPDDPPHQSPFNRRGICRVVREVYADGTLSPIYLISVSTWAGWTADMLEFPLYSASEDAGFVATCEALLGDKLAVQQWLDEHGDDDERISIKGSGHLSAFSYYHIDDDNIVGLWKFGRVARSEDGGKTWHGPVYEPSLVMPGSKEWGQKTADGKYALVWTPTHSQNSRWPLAVATSEDGIGFSNLLCVHGEVPLARYQGLYKDSGPQYMRGLSEYSQQPDDNCMWLTYSVNKEDIWVSRVPLPIAGTVETDADENFADREASPFVDGWNVYSPKRCPVAVKRYGSRSYLELRDSDPADYARATKIFRARPTIELTTRVQIKRADAKGSMWLEVCGAKNEIAAAICLNDNHELSFLSALEREPLMRMELGVWYEIKMIVDCTQQRFTLTVNGEDLGMFTFSYPVWEVERVTFRTAWRRTAPSIDAQLYAGRAFVNDVTAEADAEEHEIIALVDYLKTAPADPFQQTKLFEA